jgi:hypothetical protein
MPADPHLGLAVGFGFGAWAMWFIPILWRAAWPRKPKVPTGRTDSDWALLEAQKLSAERERDSARAVNQHLVGEVATLQAHVQALQWRPPNGV